MKFNILLVEDDEQIREIMKDYFSASGYTVFEAEDGEEAITAFNSQKIDLVILDIMLPKLDGWEVCKNIRNSSNVPIIMLTARTNTQDQLLGFELGADEYVSKPFSYKVLVARAAALLNRVYTSQDNSTYEIIKFGDIEINKSSHEVRVNNSLIELSPKEYSLLLCLFENKGVVMSRETLLDKVWGFDYFGDTRAVDTYIKKLRKKLLTASSYIKTVTGSGYKLEVNDEN